MTSLRRHSTLLSTPLWSGAARHSAPCRASITEPASRPACARLGGGGPEIRTGSSNVPVLRLIPREENGGHAQALQKIHSDNNMATRQTHYSVEFTNGPRVPLSTTTI